MDLIETKIKMSNIDRVDRSSFGGLDYVTNLVDNYNSGVLITWRPDYFQVLMVASCA